MIDGNPKRIIGFDIARAVSIIWVVLYHSLDYSDLWYQHSAVKSLTYASLAIFTFLSGFLLASRYDFHKKGGITTFYKKRFIRFYPLFFLSSIILLLIGFNTFFNTAKGLLGLSPFWAPHPRTMWYCAMLISLYFVTPFWARGGIWKQTAKFAMTMFVIIGIQFLYHCVEPRTFFYFPFYFIGIIVAQNGYDKFLAQMKSYGNCIVSMFLYVLVWGMQFIISNSILKWGGSILGMYALLSFYVLIGERLKGYSRVLSVISILSYASLCIYLFHREIDESLLLLCQPKNPYVIFLYVGILGLIITIPFAYYIQKVYDRFIQMMKL